MILNWILLFLELMLVVLSMYWLINVIFFLFSVRLVLCISIGVVLFIGLIVIGNKNFILCLLLFNWNMMLLLYVFELLWWYVIIGIFKLVVMKVLILCFIILSLLCFRLLIIWSCILLKLFLLVMVRLDFFVIVCDWFLNKLRLVFFVIIGVLLFVGFIMIRSVICLDFVFFVFMVFKRIWNMCSLFFLVVGGL